MSHFRAVIFDVDGTLVDSNDAHARAWSDAFRTYGIQVPFRRVRPLVGAGAEHLIPELTGIPFKSPAGGRIVQAHDQLFRAEYLPTLSALPGVRALLERVRADGKRIAAASLGTRQVLDRVLVAAGIRDLVHAQVAMDVATSTKVDIDLAVFAVATLKQQRSEVVMVGDSSQDLAGAIRAGIPVIALRSGGVDDFTVNRAVAVYDDAADLLACYEVSPLSETQGNGSSAGGSGTSKTLNHGPSGAMPRMSGNETL
jgi:beta-phosphoglucomutase-like phosphatase (HAD superfamily)